MQNNTELYNTSKQATYKLSITNVLVRPTGDRHPFKAKPIWILMKQEMMEWQWCLDDMQIICTLLQTDSHANTSLLNLLQADALPNAQPTGSNH